MIEFIDRLYHMDWHTDCTSLISDGTSDTLSDPPCRIRRELKSSIWVEFIDGAKESYVSLLDKVKETKTSSHIFLRDRDDETEIGFCKSLASLLISLLDEVAKSDLLLSIDEGESTDLVEIHTDRVI